MPMRRLLRTYWRFLQRRALNADGLPGRLSEMRWQIALWFIPIALAALFSELVPAFEPPRFVLIALVAMTLFGTIFVGSAIAVVQVDKSVRPGVDDQ